MLYILKSRPGTKRCVEAAEDDRDTKIARYVKRQDRKRQDRTRQDQSEALATGSASGSGGQIAAWAAIQPRAETPPVVAGKSLR